MKKFLSVLLAVMMVLSTVSFAAPSAVGTVDTGLEAPVFVPETFEEAELAGDYDGKYGEIVFKIDFENAEAGEIDLSSGVKISELGATINPAYPNAADLVLKNLNGAYYTEILDDATNYLYYTGVAGTSGLIYLAGNKGLTDKSGAYVLTCDLDYVNYSGTATVPLTTRFTAEHTLSPAVENVGTDVWSTETNEYNFREFVARSNDLSKVGSVANVDSFKFFGNNGVAADDELYIDNITLYYVSDTATVTVAMGDKGEDVVIDDYPTKGLTVAELAELLPFVEGYKVVGFSDVEGGAALDSLAVGGDTTFYPIWEEQSIYGELLFELNFDEAPVGEFDINSGDNKYYSIIGGTIGSKAAFDNFLVNNGSGDNYPAMDAEVIERAEGDNYLSLTTNAAGSKNLFQISPAQGAFFVAEEGYLVATADVLWGTSAASQPFEFVYNWKQQAENGDQDEVNNVTQNGGWGTVVSYYDAEIGLEGSGGNATAITDVTMINYLKIHGNGSVVSGETFGIDNIRLFWVPKTAELTIKVDGQDDIVISDYPTTGMELAELAAKLPEIENMKFVGFSLNPDGELLDSTRIARDTTVYPVYEERIVLDSSLEFNAASDISNISFRTGKNNSLGTGFASIMEDSYMRLTFTGTDTTRVVQDTGFNYTLPAAIPAGGFLEMEMRVRFTGMPTTATVLNQAESGTRNFNPSAVEWPEMYYNGATIHDANNKTSIDGLHGEWFTITYTPAEMGVANVDLTQLRYDFYDYMPSGSTLDIDYIRFIAEPEIEEEPVCGNCGGAHETEECPEVEPDEPDVNTEFLGKYGELVLEVNFEKLPVGKAGTAFEYNMQDGGAAKGNFISNYGSRVNPDFAAANTEIYFRNESGVADIEIKEDAEHGKYVSYTITSSGTSKNVWDLATYNGLFTEKDGYFIYTFDYLAPKDGKTVVMHWNRSHNAEDLVKVAEKETYPAGGAWGEYRSIYDADSIGKSTHVPPIAGITEINHILAYQSSQAVGETYAIDNVRLWWLPKSVDVTVVKGTNASVSDFTTKISPTATVGDLMNLVPAGTMTLAGLSLTEGGELLAKDAVLAFVEDTTLYPKWIGAQTVTVDMGDNLTASPVTMVVNATTTVGDVLAKMVDHGDKKFVGLSRTEGGAVLASTELINATEEETTLYAIWEDYEYLTYYSLNFGFNDIGRYRVQQNNGQSSVTLNDDGTLTLKAIPVTGYTGTWDHQIYVETFNASTALPAGVVSEIAVRMRYRNVPAAKATYTIQNRTDTAFDPASNAAYVHIGKYGATAWGQQLQSKDRRETNIVDGQWFTRYLDAETYFKEGLSYVRFDTPYPMPAGMEVDIDFIRFLGDNDDERIPATAVAPELMPNFSTDFDEGNDGFSFVSWRNADEEGNVTGFSEYHDGVVGKNSAYTGDNYANYITWNEDGFVTLNFDASEEAKASAAANGYTAAIYDAVAYFSALDKTVALDAGALNKIQMRVRFRGIPSAKQNLWRHDNSTVVDNYNPAALFYFHAMNSLDAIGTAGIYQANFVTSSNVVSGSYAPDEWFVVDLPASFFKADASVLDLLRLDLNDAMPDGSKMDIDFIHFYGVENVIESVGPVEKPDEPDVPVVPDELVPGAGDDVRVTYSAEFNDGEEGVDLVSWKKADGTYMYDDGVNGDSGVGIGSAFIGDAEDYITWNEDGYATINFVANEEVKAAAAAKGATAFVYDASAYVSSLDEAAYLEAGELKEIKIRMRLRDLPVNGTALYGQNYGGYADATWSLDDTNSHFYFHYSNVVGGELYAGATATSKSFDGFEFTEGAYVADEWFEITIPASYFKADTSALEILRLNIPDAMPDGSKLDIDYIRFIGNDADYAPVMKNSYSVRTGDKEGIRFKAVMTSAVNAVATEFGYVVGLESNFADTSALVVGAAKTVTGYGRQEGVDLVKFFEEDDDYKYFTAVITNVGTDNLDTRISVKPFVKVDGEYVYGDVRTASIREVCKALKASEGYEDLSEEEKLYIDGIAE